MSHAAERGQLRNWLFGCFALVLFCTQFCYVAFILFNAEVKIIPLETRGTWKMETTSTTRVLKKINSYHRSVENGDHLYYKSCGANITTYGLVFVSIRGIHLWIP